MLYDYTALDYDGKLINGMEEASSPEDLAGKFSHRVLMIIEVAPRRQFGSRLVSLWQTIRETGTVSLKQKVLFCQQLTALVSAGLPLKEALGATARNCRYGPLAKRIRAVQERIEAGKPLSRAIADVGLMRSPECAIIAVGEESGRLGQVLEHITKLYALQYRMKTERNSEMVYPGIVATVAIGVVAALIFFVLPRFQTTFSRMGIPLPPMTQRIFHIVSALSEIASKGLAWGVALFVLYVLLAHWGPTKLWIGRLKLAIPFWGRRQRHSEASESLMMLSVMLESGVALLRAFDLCADTARNPETSAELQYMHDAAAHGKSIGGAAERLCLFREVAAPLIRAGEQSGQLAGMLRSAAQWHADAMEEANKRLAAMIEPLLLGTVGMIVGLVACAICLPILDFTNSLM